MTNYEIPDGMKANLGLSVAGPAEISNPRIRGRTWLASVVHRFSTPLGQRPAWHHSGVMSYKDLPKGWPDQPVTEHIEDVLDLFVDMQARVRGALMILVCDERHHAVQPIMLEDMPKDIVTDDLEGPLERLAHTIADGFPGATALVALARTGPSRVTMRDRAWAAAISRAFSGQVELIGVHSITPRGSLRIEPEAQAA